MRFALSDVRQPMKALLPPLQEGTNYDERLEQLQAAFDASEKHQARAVEYKTATVVIRPTGEIRVYQLEEDALEVESRIRDVFLIIPPDE